MKGRFDLRFHLFVFHDFTPVVKGLTGFYRKPKAKFPINLCRSRRKRGKRKTGKRQFDAVAPSPLGRGLRLIRNPTCRSRRGSEQPRNMIRTPRKLQPRRSVAAQAMQSPTLETPRRSEAATFPDSHVGKKGNV